MSDTPDRPSDLSRIFDEFLVRRRLGESPILDEYCKRFPNLAEQLRQHVRLYDVLGETGSETDVRDSLKDLYDPDEAGDAVVRPLLDKAVRRLHQLCTTVLYREYLRLTRPPLNVQPDEMLGAVVKRLLKVLRAARPTNVRQFFALASRHARWELNDLARRLDHQPASCELQDELLPTPGNSGSSLSPEGRRLIEEIDALPEDEREAFDLVRVQGLTLDEAGTVLGVATRTVKQRLDRGLRLLSEGLGDLRRSETPPDPA
jgi:RNA polymerase sigma factor (sigma-70 family)